MAEGVSVLACLPSLGFVPDESGSPHAQWDRGRIDIKAFEIPPPYKLLGVVSFVGWYKYPNILGEIDFDLPPTFPTPDHLKAVLARNLRGAFESDTGAAAAPPWIAEGLAMGHLVAELLRGDYPPPPKVLAACKVDRDWLRVALRKLVKAASNADIVAAVRVSVHGSTLRFEVGRGPVEMDAETGDPGTSGGQTGTVEGEGVIVCQAEPSVEDWPRAWSVRALELRGPVQRLMDQRLRVEVTEQYLRFAGRWYPLIPDSALSSDGLRVTCACVGADAEAAKQAVQRGEILETLEDRSHFSLNVVGCRGCGQRFLTVFHEIVSWDGGDDDQTWLALPVTAGEVARFKQAARGPGGANVSHTEWRRRYLWESGTGAVECSWESGRFWLPPIH